MKRTQPVLRMNHRDRTPVCVPAVTISLPQKTHHLVTPWPFHLRD